MNSDEIAALAKARLEQNKKYEEFDLDAKLEEQDRARKAKSKADGTYFSVTLELNGYYRFLGMPIPPMPVLTEKEVKERVRAVLTQRLDGMNGREIADAVFAYGVGSDTISDLYRQEGQSWLKKGKDSKGKVAVGADTKYLLATDADKAEIEADKKAETAREEKAKAKRDQKKKAKSEDEEEK